MLTAGSSASCYRIAKPGQPRNPLQATQVRAAFLDADIQLWTHDGETASPCELPDRTTACSLLQEGVLRGGELDLMDLASLVRDLEEWADSQPGLTAHHENPTGPGAARA